MVEEFPHSALQKTVNTKTTVSLHPIHAKSPSAVINTIADKSILQTQIEVPN